MEMFKLETFGWTKAKEDNTIRVFVNHIYIHDKYNNNHLAISKHIFEEHLGMMYMAYLIVEKVTIYYQMDGTDTVVVHMEHESLDWTYYGEDNQNIENVGKWMCFFSADSVSYISLIAQKAIELKIVKRCKHTRFDKYKKKTGVLCLYIDGNNKSDHLRVINFMIENNLIRRTKLGKLFNISFKFDFQTKKDEYGKSFKPILKLSDFIDLNTEKGLIK